MKKIAPDKKRHFYAGIFMGVVLQGFLSFLLPAHLVLSAIVAFVLIVGISYGFELFSKFSGKGHYDFMDAVAGAVGGVLGMALFLIFKWQLIV